MLFNSYEFIFIFLPISFFIYTILAKANYKAAAIWLTAISIVFYGNWNYHYIALLLFSIVLNYSAGYLICTYIESKSIKWANFFVILGVSFNLILLLYYKYYNFFISNLNSLYELSLENKIIVLPLGISFYTFTQIAFLVDAYSGKVKERNLLHYMLFVTYFPHLIAGPVLHHKEMMPQFDDKNTYNLKNSNISLGLSLFSFGLFKKVILADTASKYVAPVFDAASQGNIISTFEAWGASLCYAFQLYFDFSGYSDMAVGLSWLFGVMLPINFNSPYKASNIIDFWRRWHITLSRFLRDYLYIPLGGNKKGKLRRYINLFITMFLGGMWHGANWTFIMWGCLHGLYLIVNNIWIAVLSRSTYQILQKSVFYRSVSTVITFLSVVLAWVIFRANTLDAAVNIMRGMFGMNGTLISFHWIEDDNMNWLVEWMLANHMQVNFNPSTAMDVDQLELILLMMLICWLMPNTNQIFQLADNKGISGLLVWKPNAIWLTATILVGLISVLSLSDMSEFIYYQF